MYFGGSGPKNALAIDDIVNEDHSNPYYLSRALILAISTSTLLTQVCSDTSQPHPQLAHPLPGI